jgi:hypothetical protein
LAHDEEGDVSEQRCVDCVRQKIDERRSTRWCSADGAHRCREQRTAHLARLGVGKPVPQPPATVGRQGSFL